VSWVFAGEAGVPAEALSLLDFKIYNGDNVRIGSSITSGYISAQVCIGPGICPEYRPSLVFLGHVMEIQAIDRHRGEISPG
jgi:hypothetical protein